MCISNSQIRLYFLHFLFETLNDGIHCFLLESNEFCLASIIIQMKFQRCSSSFYLYLEYDITVFKYLNVLDWSFSTISCTRTFQQDFSLNLICDSPFTFELYHLNFRIGSCYHPKTILIANLLQRIILIILNPRKRFQMSINDLIDLFRSFTQSRFETDNFLFYNVILCLSLIIVLWTFTIYLQVLLCFDSK